MHELELLLYELELALLLRYLFSFKVWILYLAINCLYFMINFFFYFTLRPRRGKFLHLPLTPASMRINSSFEYI